MLLKPGALGAMASCHTPVPDCAQLRAWERHGVPTPQGSWPSGTCVPHHPNNFFQVLYNHLGYFGSCTALPLSQLGFLFLGLLCTLLNASLAKDGGFGASSILQKTGYILFAFTWLSLAASLEARRLSTGRRGLLGICAVVQYISVPGP